MIAKRLPIKALLSKTSTLPFIRVAALRYLSDTPKFGDFTQKIDEASLKPPTLEDNEIKLDSKCCTTIYAACWYRVLCV